MDSSVGKVWAAVHCMPEVVRKMRMPVLEDGGVVATRDVEKAKMCESKFKAVHSVRNIGEEGIRERNETFRQHTSKLKVNDDNSDAVNLFFFMTVINSIWKGEFSLQPGGKH